MNGTLAFIHEIIGLFQRRIQRIQKNSRHQHHNFDAHHCHNGKWFEFQMIFLEQTDTLKYFCQIFLAVELPLGIITILHTISSTILDFLDYSAVKSIVLAVNLCMCLSYPLNFGIYCGMSRQFRETFQDLFFKRVIGRRRKGKKSTFVTLFSNSNLDL